MNQSKTLLSILVFSILFSGLIFSQALPEDSLENNASSNDTLIERLQLYESFDVPRNFKDKYKLTMDKVIKVYPLALYAAEVIDSLEYELGNIKRKGKQRRATRKTHKDLKGDFKFLLKDLYISEGQILTKLIYRETGMTVREIVKKYKTGFEAALYSTTAKIFEQDLDAVYKPNTDDFVIECIVQDIKSGKIAFDPTFETMNRAEFMEIKKEEKQVRKERKQRNKKIKRDLKNKRNKDQTAQKSKLKD